MGAWEEDDDMTPEEFDRRLAKAEPAEAVVRLRRPRRTPHVPGNGHVVVASKTYAAYGDKIVRSIGPSSVRVAASAGARITSNA